MYVTGNTRLQLCTKLHKLDFKSQTNLIMVYARLRLCDITLENLKGLFDFAKQMAETIAYLLEYYY